MKCDYPECTNEAERPRYDPQLCDEHWEAYEEYRESQIGH